VGMAHAAIADGDLHIARAGRAALDLHCHQRLVAGMGAVGMDSHGKVPRRMGWPHCPAPSWPARNRWTADAGQQACHGRAGHTLTASSPGPAETRCAAAHALSPPPDRTLLP